MQERFTVIDIDGHVNMECAKDWLSYFPKPEAESMETRLLSNRSHPNDRSGAKEIVYQGIRDRNRSVGGWEPDVRLKDMDSEGIDVAVVFPTEMGLNQDAYSPAVAAGYNTWLAEYCSADPKRLKGVALLPLGDVEAAKKELRRVVNDLDFVGVFMKPTVDEKRCDDEHFSPIYAEMEELDVPLLLHVTHGCVRVLKEAFGYDFVKAHAAMHPFGNMLAMADVFYGGLVERFKKLRVGFMEGQASWIPWALWRLDEQHQEYYSRPGMKSPLKKLPSEYVQEGRFFFSCDPEEKYLDFAVKHLEDSIVWASDYPHSDGIFPGAVTTFLEAQQQIPAAQKAKLLRHNSEALVGRKLA